MHIHPPLARCVAEAVVLAQVNADLDQSSPSQFLYALANTLGGAELDGLASAVLFIARCVTASANAAVRAESRAARA